MDAEERGIVLI